MKIVGIYLAAGGSKRMGTDKRMLPVGVVPLGSIALKQALLSKLGHIFIVTRQGDQLDWLPESFFELPEQQRWTQVECARADKGKGFSLSSGIKKASESGAAAAMVILSDQPFVTFTIIDTLIDSFNDAPSPFVGASGPWGNPMPPILFSRECFSLFKKLDGDRGLRDLIRAEMKEIGRTIDFQDPLLFCDIDTVEEYEALLNDLNHYWPTRTEI